MIYCANQPNIGETGKQFRTVTFCFLLPSCPTKRVLKLSCCVSKLLVFTADTSKLMWMNVPISILFVCGLRVLFNEVEFRWKVRKVRQQTYLAHLEKKQLVANDSRLSTTPPSPKWKRKINSPIVKAAMEEFVNKLLHDFVTDMWYSDITPDKEAPELMRAIIMDVLGEIYGRFKEMNLVDLLTRYLFLKNFHGSQQVYLSLCIVQEW